ncbi:cytochrome c biogenesis protein CcdA [soil metagenome]
MKYFIGSFFVFLSFSVPAQILYPVQWETEVKNIDDKNLALFIKAKMDSGWHIYSQHIEEGGPIPTSIIFYDLKSKKNLSNSWNEIGHAETVYDSTFSMDLTYYGEEVAFVTSIPLAEVGNEFSGSIKYMVCDSEFCLPPADEPLAFVIEDVSSLPKANSEEIASIKSSGKEGLKSPPDPENKPARSYWALFFTAFLGGFAALLTPCVFPIIPLTVSYFTKRSTTKAKGISQALLFGLSIILIYISLGYGVTLLFGIDALNALATNVWVNLLFFILLVVFAISFLGGFDIVLPSSFINKVDAQSERGGVVGIFFMAFTLALVSFSCTGPIIGTLLFESAVSGNMMGPVIGMTGFSLALALPFGFFAAFPGWLSSLPKSGNWMNSVKVVLGFLELALALKFLSNADLVLQAGLVTREVFIALWAAVFGLLSLYLLGFIRFPHDSPSSSSISVGRGLFAIVTLAFTLYLIPGLWGAPLKLISGFPPPDFYKEWNQGPTSIILNDNKTQTSGHGATCPNNLDCFHDYDEALAYARQTGKPLLLDFTGWACVNCRKMEANVWTDPEVAKRLREDVILVSLYVDDKRELPLDEQVIKKLGKKDFSIKTIGNKWSFFQADRFKINSQPYYVLVDASENTLGIFEGYNSSVDSYLKFLDDARPSTTVN